MKKILILMLILNFIIHIDVVNALSCDECGQYQEGTTAHFNCLSECTETEQKTTYSKIQCGDVKIPYIFAKTSSIVVMVLQILVPVIIIVIGSFDLIKAIVAQKEDEIKKGWQTFIKRLIVGVIVFLVIAVVKFVIGFVADNSELNCIDCFVNDKCDVN